MKWKNMLFGIAALLGGLVHVLEPYWMNPLDYLGAFGKMLQLAIGVVLVWNGATHFYKMAE